MNKFAWATTVTLGFAAVYAPERTAAAGVGVAGQPCTVADYQAANDCMSSWYGTIATACGNCDLDCGGAGIPASQQVQEAAGQAVIDTVAAIPTVIVQVGTQIYQCATEGGFSNCVPVAIIVGGMVCAAVTGGACIPVMAAGGAIIAMGNCAGQCLLSNDPTACQQACAGSIIATTAGAVSSGLYYASTGQLGTVIGAPEPPPPPVVVVDPVPPPPPPPPPLPPPFQPQAPTALTAEEALAIFQWIKSGPPGAQATLLSELVYYQNGSLTPGAVAPAAPPGASPAAALIAYLQNYLATGPWSSAGPLPPPPAL